MDFFDAVWRPGTTSTSTPRHRGICRRGLPAQRDAACGRNAVRLGRCAKRMRRRRAETTRIPTRPVRGRRRRIDRSAPSPPRRWRSLALACQRHRPQRHSVALSRDVGSVRGSAMGPKEDPIEDAARRISDAMAVREASRLGGIARPRMPQRTLNPPCGHCTVCVSLTASTPRTRLGLSHIPGRNHLLTRTYPARCCKRLASTHGEGI